MAKSKNRLEKRLKLLQDATTHLSSPLQEMISLYMANCAPQEDYATHEREAEKILEILQLSKTEREIQARIRQLQNAKLPS